MSILRTPDGKRLRTPEEFIRDQGDDPVSKVIMYNAKEKLVMEAWKNMKTKRTHILKVRRPTGQEEAELGKMLRQQKLLNPNSHQNQDQVEVIIQGDKYEKKLQSR